MKIVKAVLFILMVLSVLPGHNGELISQVNDNKSFVNNEYNLSSLEWKLWGYRPESWKMDFNFTELTGPRAEYVDIPAKVPGSVQQSLKDAGIIKDWNIGSNFIDIGNGLKLSNKAFKISELSNKDIRCKAFYRPSPNIRINANGEVSVCPLLSSGEGYGNIHNQPLIEILNNMQDSFIYKLHSERLINNYLKYWDINQFGDRYEHPCSVRAVLSILARKMDKHGYNYTTKKDEIMHLIKEVGEECGFNI